MDIQKLDAEIDKLIPKISREIDEALPPELQKAFGEYTFLTLFRVCRPPTTFGIEEAQKIMRVWSA